MMFGVSTSVLTDKADLDRLLDYEPDVVEFYNYPSGQLDRIVRLCADNGIRPALHTPVPYDDPEPLTRFAPTGPTSGEVRQAIALVEQTLRTAAELSAVHVVAHFPSPYSGAGPVTKHATKDFLGPLSELAHRLGVRLLLENMSGHRGFWSADDYLGTLELYPSIGLCLDWGHCQDLPPEGSFESFARVAGGRIDSCHVYAPGRRCIGDPASVSRFDVESDLRTLFKYASPSCLILEHDPPTINDLPRAIEDARWFRSMVDRIDVPMPPL